MKKSQVTLLALSASVLSLLAATSVAHAGDYKGYKDSVGCGETCPPWVLFDGLYIGAAAGYDSYRVVNDVTSNGFLLNTEGDVAYATDTRLSANGVVGGLFGGYGKYFKPYRGFTPYLALELFLNASSAFESDEVSEKNPPDSNVQHIFKNKFTAKNNYGISLLPGLKMTDYTLLYVRLGYNWSEMAVDESFLNTDAPLGRFGHHRGIELDDGDEITQGGFNYGVGVESAFYDNLSARLEFTHTDYGSFHTDIDTNVKVEDNQMMLSVIYHFNFPKIFRGWNP